MLVLGFKIVLGVFIALCCIGAVIGAASLATAEIRHRLEQRRLSNRWKENADPFIGAP